MNKSTINNIFETELTTIYRDGYDDGYNHGINDIFNPKSEDAEYMDGYNDGQTDACEYSS